MYASVCILWTLLLQRAGTEVIRCFCVCHNAVSVCVGDGECGRCAELQHLCVSESSTLCSVAVPGDQESEFAAGSELDGCRAQASLCVKYLDLRHNNAGCGTDVAFILDVNREIMSSACGPKSAFAIANSL